MRFVQGILLAVASSFLVACGGGSPIDRTEAIMEKAYSIVDSNKGDLDKAAKELTAFLAEKKAEMQAIEKEMNDLKAKDPAKAEELDKAAQAKLMPIMTKLMAIPGIMEHEGVQKAFAAMSGEE